MKKRFLIPLFSILIIDFSYGLTIHVPGDFPAIQEGIDESTHGDTVLVSPGTYTGSGNRDIEFRGKGILLKSVSGPESTVIDCEGDVLDQHRGFLFRFGEGNDSILEGFTVRNGYVLGHWPGGSGGGILCSNASSPTITNCSITLNLAEGYGGGIFCDGYYGACDPIITDCTITENLCTDSGGGLFSWFGSSPRLFDCVISSNTADGDGTQSGGGLTFGDDSRTLIVRCSITGNEATYGFISGYGIGGGIHCAEGNGLIMEDCFVSLNSAVNFGGGIYCSNSTFTMNNCTIAANETQDAGGGIYLTDSSRPILTNCTIAGNDADDGCGLFIEYESFPVLTNCILWADSHEEIQVESGDIAVTYSNIEGGWPGEGNICSDPRFVEPYQLDFGLKPDSPCIDSGDPTFSNVPWGGSRRDMGAFEFELGWYLNEEGFIVRKPLPAIHITGSSYREG